MMKDIQKKEYRDVTVIQYLRGMTKEIPLTEPLQIEYSFGEEQLSFYFVMPDRMNGCQNAERCVIDNGVTVRFYSSFYVSIEFPLVSLTTEEMKKTEESIREFLLHSSLVRNLQLSSSLMNERKERFSSLLTAKKCDENVPMHQQENGKMCFETETFSITVYYSTEHHPFNLILLNRGWHLKTSHTSLTTFPFVNYHMYFNEENHLLSDFTRHSINTIVISSHGNTDLFDSYNESTFNSQPHHVKARMTAEHNYVFGRYDHHYDPNTSITLKEEIVNGLHALLQKFMTVEIAHANRTRFESLAIAEKIGECVDEITRENRLDQKIVESCSITPQLMQPQVVQNVMLSAVTNRIDF